MLDAVSRSRPLSEGVSRRSLLHTGLAGMLGLSLPDLLRLQANGAEAGRKREASVIFIELAGGPTQHETYDPKPNAPLEYRGPLAAIETSLPGEYFSELMVQQAKVADKLAVIRSITHDSGSHSTSAHLTQTGYYLRSPQNRENEMPSAGSITARLRGSSESGVPAYVSIPNSTRFGRAAWMSRAYNPFETVNNGDVDNFQVPNLTLNQGLTGNRLDDRRTLLTAFDASRKQVDNQGVADAMDQFTRQAFELVTGPAARKAFNLASEDPRIRAKYGLNATGQNLLLARRLVEHGVPFVTVRVNGWDDHGKIAQAMKAKGPAYDQGVAALVEDLYSRGLDKQVLMVCIGEFGRTPRVNASAGRDHWGQVMSVVMSGGGLRTGQIIGSSDRHGATPLTRPYRPENVLAMIYRHLEIDTTASFTDNSGRPRFVLERRELITELISS